MGKQYAFQKPDGTFIQKSSISSANGRICFFRTLSAALSKFFNPWGLYLLETFEVYALLKLDIVDISHLTREKSGIPVLMENRWGETQDSNSYKYAEWRNKGLCEMLKDPAISAKLKTAIAERNINSEFVVRREAAEKGIKVFEIDEDKVFRDALSKQGCKFAKISKAK